MAKNRFAKLPLVLQQVEQLDDVHTCMHCCLHMGRCPRASVSSAQSQCRQWSILLYIVVLPFLAVESQPFLSGEPGTAM